MVLTYEFLSLVLSGIFILCCLFFTTFENFKFWNFLFLTWALFWKGIEPMWCNCYWIQKIHCHSSISVFQTIIPFLFMLNKKDNLLGNKCQIVSWNLFSSLAWNRKFWRNNFNTKHVTLKLGFEIQRRYFKTMKAHMETFLSE